MLHDSWVRGYRLAFAPLTFVAVAYQHPARAAPGNFNPIKFVALLVAIGRRVRLRIEPNENSMV